MSAAVAPVPAVSGRQHLYWIDSLRFLAAAAVLLDHACQWNWVGPDLRIDGLPATVAGCLLAPVHLGRQAVVVFFVLSGALVGGLTLRKVRAGTFDPTVYAADRLSRVYVPLIPALLLTVAALQMLDASFAPLQYVACLFGLQGVCTEQPFANKVLWTLSYEVWFYVLAGCAAVVATRTARPRGVRWTAWAGGALALGLLCFRLDWIYLVCWLLGAAGFALSDRIKPSARSGVSAAGVCLMLAGVGASRANLVTMLPVPELFRASLSLPSVATLLLAVGTLLFFAGVCRSVPTTRTGAWIERLGAPLAAFSYTLYLTHFPVLLCLAWFDASLPPVLTWHSVSRLCGWMLVCVIVALVMYGLFEARTSHVRRWLRKASRFTMTSARTCSRRRRGGIRPAASTITRTNMYG